MITSCYVMINALPRVKTVTYVVHVNAHDEQL